MQSQSLKLTIKLTRNQDKINHSIVPNHRNSMEGEPNTSSMSTLGSSPDATPHDPFPLTEGEENHNAGDEENHTENAQNQLVLYDPSVISARGTEATPDPIDDQRLRRFPFTNQPSRILPAVGAFTVQCANCFKWRIVPSKEMYEKIREHIIEQPFLCERACEWQRDISCDDPPDIMQDGSRLWAIDKPSIAQPPSGWERLLRIRGEGSSKFADVYYVAPSGKRLRSMVEIQKYLNEHPEYVEEGVTMSRFSFQIPRPLQENYVRKRPAHPAPPNDATTDHGTPMPLESSQVKSIGWVDSNEDTTLQLGSPGLSAPYIETPILKTENQPSKKKRTSSKERCSASLVCHADEINVEQSRPI